MGFIPSTRVKIDYNIIANFKLGDATARAKNLRSCVPVLQVGITPVKCNCYYYKPHPFVNMIGQYCALSNSNECISKHAGYQLCAVLVEFLSASSCAKTRPGLHYSLELY